MHLLPYGVRGCKMKGIYNYDRMLKKWHVGVRGAKMKGTYSGVYSPQV